MKCPKCGSKYITVVNRPIQLEEKTKSITMDFFTGIAIFVFVLSITIFLIIRLSNSSNSELEKIAAYSISLILLKWSGITLLACGIINSVRPHKMDNKLLGVCMDCGHAEALKAFKETVEKKTETVSEEENKEK